MWTSPLSGRGSSLLPLAPHPTPPCPAPGPLSILGGDTNGVVTIGLKGRTHDWLQEETFLFLNLDQWKPFYFYFLTIILKKEKKFEPRVYGFPRSSPSSGALFGSLFRNVRRSDWRLKLEKDLIGWLMGTFFFFFSSLIGCRC